MRIKVADDNDLKTARAGLELALGFFEALARVAAERGTDGYQLLQQVEL